MKWPGSQAVEGKQAELHYLYPPFPVFLTRFEQYDHGGFPEVN